MTFIMNFTEESVWVTIAFSSRQLFFWNHRQHPKTYLVGFCLYSAVTHKRFVNNSVPAITPTCTSYSDHLIRSSQYVMLQNIKFLYILFSPTLFRPDSRHLFSSFSQVQTAGNFNRKKLPYLKKIVFQSHAFNLHWNVVL